MQFETPDFLRSVRPPESHPRHERAEGLVALLILVALFAAFVGWLFYQQYETKKDGREYVRETLVRLLVDHDPNYLEPNLSSDLRRRYHAGSVAYINESLAKMGVPRQPFDIDGKIVFAERFFSPSGTFTAHLTYPHQRAFAYLEISQKSGHWQLDAFSVSPDNE